MERSGVKLLGKRAPPEDKFGFSTRSTLNLASLQLLGAGLILAATVMAPAANADLVSLWNKLFIGI